MFWRRLASFGVLLARQNGGNFSRRRGKTERQPLSAFAKLQTLFCRSGFAYMHLSITAHAFVEIACTTNYSYYLLWF